MNIWRLKTHGLCATASSVMLAATTAAPVQFAQLPAPVQKGITTQLGGAKIGEIDREEEDGEVIYTVEATTGARTVDYTLDENGTLLSVEVALTETPLAVQKTIQSQIGQGAVESVDKSFEDGKVSYEVDFKTKEGAERSLTVLENGQLDSIEVDLTETPPAVQATVAKESAGGQVKSVEKTFDDKAVFYDVTINRGGVNRDIEVAENGKVESRQVFLTEVPPAVQNTIQQTLGPAKLRSIDHVLEKKKGGSTFEVEAVKDGKSFVFSVGPKGAFLGMEQ
jgi:uncharacterized membrane protein YkoI